MLARDSSTEGTGLGDFLLVSALHLSKKRQTSGVFGVELLAENDRLVAWYEHFGFVAIQKRDDGKSMMFIHKGAIP